MAAISIRMVAAHPPRTPGLRGKTAATLIQTAVANRESITSVSFLVEGRGRAPRLLDLNHCLLSQFYRGPLLPGGIAEELQGH
jgi:hypothetical protein